MLNYNNNYNYVILYIYKNKKNSEAHNIKKTL